MDSVVDTGLSNEHWWNDNDKQETQIANKNLSRRDTVQNSATNYHGIKPGPPRYAND